MADDVIEFDVAVSDTAPKTDDGTTITIRVGTPLEEVERRVTMATLAYCGHVKRKAAEILGVSLKTLYNRLETYNGKEAIGPGRQGRGSGTLRTRARLNVCQDDSYTTSGRPRRGGLSSSHIGSWAGARTLSCVNARNGCMPATRVAVVDDHQLVRIGLKQIIEAPVGFRLGRRGQDRAARRSTLLRGAPCDVLLLDLSLPDMSGLDVLRQIKAHHETVATLVLSAYPENQYGLNVLRAGASGFVSKTADDAELCRAIRAAVRGGRYVSPELAEMLVSGMQGGCPASRGTACCRSASSRSSASSPKARVFRRSRPSCS